MKIAVIAVASKTGEKGGAERFFEGLVHALRISGVDTDLVNLISDESSFDTIKETLLNFYDLDLSAYDGVISTKAPSYFVRHNNHICYLVHTMRAFYDMFEKEFPYPTPEVLEQRKFITTLDAAVLAYPGVKRIFTIGNTVSNRLQQYNNLKSEVLHPALSFDKFKSGEYKNYLFMPGRLHRWKRVSLVLKAMKYVKKPIILKIAGIGEDEEELRTIAGKDKRIEFLGRVSDTELINLYADALAVPFVPFNEDYGYITLEAFKSEKPVITCLDSGEPAFFVKDNINGFTCEPNPKIIAKKIEYLFDNHQAARTMGANGLQSINHITWGNVAKKLLNALGLS
jgi:glycosyltransferase involved in cell wall biosynthesis